ncbi:hypothetical protein ACQ7HM_10275 [Williamsia sp. MIQD14]|uniref:hypothetical protein n=1 Tax=Williamsia sp. MIQD14 TaxID=3425703 RepID=UPI003DA0C493
MIDTAEFTWHKAADRRTRSLLSFLILAVLMVFIGAVSALFGDYWITGFAVAFLVAGYPALMAPAPRLITLTDSIEARQRKPWTHSHWVFPVMMLIAAVSLTVPVFAGSITGGAARLPYIAALAWFLVFATLIHALRNRGTLRLSRDSVGVAGRFATPLVDADFALVQIRKLAFPQLEMTLAQAPKRVLFPTMCFGLEANSLYSTLRHLAEADPATRDAYSPELIREMLLFTPDREVAVGESIEVRVVARPRTQAA